MNVLGIVGESDERTRFLTERLVEFLDGRVATVQPRDRLSTSERGDVSRPPAGAEASIALADDGEWIAAGRSRTLADVLDALAPEYEYALVEGDVDATIPTVVLGDGDAAGPVVHRADSAENVDLDAVADALDDADPHVTLEALVREIKRAPDEDRAGAIATFTGRVRARDAPDDSPTEYLEFDCYDSVAAERMATLRRDLEARDGVHAVRLHHRVGVVEAGEDIVFVVVLAGHREEAFRAVEDGIDRLKAEVPLFKKEVTVDSAFWAYERSNS
jgi:molybdopterin synthase catalytic subunit